MRLNPNHCAAALIAIASSFSIEMLAAQTPVARRVMLDEAHHNIMATASGGYRPLVRLLTDAEFVVTPNALPFSRERLAMADVVVIANPNGADERATMDNRAVSAFADPEIGTVEEWVRGGGGLLLAIDHYPTGVAARRLAERFGVKLSGGWTDDPAHRWSLPGYSQIFGHLVFSVENGLLADHPITRGRDETEQIEGISTVTGGSIEGPPGSVSLLRLSPTAVDWIPSRTPRAPSNTAQQAPMKDFNPCPSCDQISSAGRSQNRQFALNAVRWLAHEF
jgi:hypothetical protein